ncbi:hypothetical protein L596_023633 [Steinernema carpocapsae]|uniref:Uncharacterized protein n=1 Tax=Steinernema carpocapsae TaxID=34508 RepID=A0A4U5MEA3_STECR|nr:hypothetical protein L596_023633 [Steinernema carpocapsae]
MESHQEFDNHNTAAESGQQSAPQCDLDSFEHFYAFITEQLEQLTDSLRARAKREIILVAEEIYGKILESNKNGNK